MRELYEIQDGRGQEDVLGEGQCGVVYKAVECRTGTEFAVKVRAVSHAPSEATTVLFEICVLLSRVSTPTPPSSLPLKSPAMAHLLLWP